MTVTSATSAPVDRTAPGDVPDQSVTADLVVSGLGLVTPWAADPAAAAAAAAAAGTPARHAPADDWFDYRAELGPRGYKYLPAASQYMLAATRRALADAGAGLDLVQAEARGAVVGTNSAASALHADMDRTVIRTSAADLSPAFAPFFSINLFGSRLAIEHMFQGFNVTLTSPRVAGLEAVQTGTRSVALGRASWLLAGATEAPLDLAEPGADTSECGAVAMILEPAAAVAARDGRSYGRCRVSSFFLPPALAGSPEGPRAARAGLDAALEALGWPRTGRDGDGGPQFPVGSMGLPVRAVLDDSPVGTALGTALGPGAVRVAAGAGCLEPLVQVAAELAGGRGRTDDTGGATAVVVCAAAEGNVALALITRDPPGGGTPSPAG